MKEKEFWTREALNGVSKALLEGICKTLKKPTPTSVLPIRHSLRPGGVSSRSLISGVVPASLHQEAHYSDKVVADYYDFEEVPVYYEHKGTVGVKNPFFRPSDPASLVYRIISSRDGCGTRQKDACSGIASRMNEILSYLSDNNLWFLTRMNENLLSREDPEKDLVTRAFALLYDEFNDHPHVPLVLWRSPSANKHEPHVVQVGQIPQES
jgi:hypothetical protein